MPDIVDRLLAEWGIEHAWSIDRGKYPELEHRVQYGGSDYAFLCRMLEEAGIFGASMHVEPVRSTRQRRNLVLGHCWVVLSIVVDVPWSQRPLAA